MSPHHQGLHAMRGVNETTDVAADRAPDVLTHREHLLVQERRELHRLMRLALAGPLDARAKESACILLGVLW